MTSTLRESSSETGVLLYINFFTGFFLHIVISAGFLVLRRIY